MFENWTAFERAYVGLAALLLLLAVVGGALTLWLLHRFDPDRRTRKKQDGPG